MRSDSSCPWRRNGRSASRIVPRDRWWNKWRATRMGPQVEARGAETSWIGTQRGAWVSSCSRRISENVAEGCRAGSDGYRAHIEGIQNLQKRRPWASLFDELLFFEGLRAGLEVHGRKCITRSQDRPSSPWEGD